MLYKGYNQKSIPLPPIVVLALVETWTWFLQLPGIFAAADRFPLERRVLLRSLLAQGTLFALAHIAIRILVTSYLPWSSEPALLSSLLSIASWNKEN